MDFTIKTYKRLLEILQNKGYVFQSFVGYIQNPEKKVIILRHDVDKLPENSLNVALLESSLGIKGSYYFRIVPYSYNKEIINKVTELGHEVGYHYEDLGTTAQQHKGITAEKEIVEIAIESFRKNLELLREIVPVKTICMHGSPKSKWDSRLLWKYNNYHDFGIVGEPYFDVNFEDILYLTDTGRSWNSASVNIRDKGLGTRDKELGIIGAKRRSSTERKGIRNKGLGTRDLVLEEEVFKDWKVKPMPESLMNMTPASIDFQSKHKFRLTFDIIKAAEEGMLPDKVMMTFHPQRWTDRPIQWVRELIWQNVKNVAKYFLIKLRD